MTRFYRKDQRAVKYCTIVAKGKKEEEEDKTKKKK
jgi:hypothetical protein